jgi:hypothetical protein
VKKSGGKELKNCILKNYSNYFIGRQKNLLSQKVLPFKEINMKKIIPFTILIPAAIFLFSCNNKSKDKLIVGKWAFEKMESRSRTAEDINTMSKNTAGLVATFNENGTFNSIKPKDGYNDTLAAGTYELADKGKFIVTHEHGQTHPDSVEIIELTAKILKVQTSGRDTLVLKKIQ